jgi:hypothetical protein
MKNQKLIEEEYKNKKDDEELYNTHKMFTELACLDKTNGSEENISDEYVSDIKLEETIEFEEIKLDLSLSRGNSKEEINEDSSFGKFALDKTLREELISTLGDDLLNYLISIVKQNLPEKEYRIDVDKIKLIVKEELKNKIEEEKLLIVLEKIYEVWSIVIQERQIEAKERKNSNFYNNYEIKADKYQI